MATTRGDKPSALLRWFLRAPIWLYKAHLGFLFGERFLMFRHVGRKSGQDRYTVVEVVSHDRATDTFCIASGWGEHSDWFKNATKTPEVTVFTKQRKFEAIARRLEHREARDALLLYGQNHPTSLRQLSRIMIEREVPIDIDGCADLANHVPVFALEHRSDAARSQGPSDDNSAKARPP